MKYKNELGNCISLEMGKVTSEGLGEVFLIELGLRNY